MRPLAVALSLFAAAGASAQALRWDIPHRGALVYERKTERFEVSGPPRLRGEPVLPKCEDGGSEWHWCAGNSAAEVPAGFELPGFDDQAWKVGKGMFGTDPGKDSRQRTLWNVPELCLRTTVDLGKKKPRFVLFRIHHDDSVRVWWNGRQVVADDVVGADKLYVVGGADLDAWQRGDNLLAARCTNTGGAQYLDVAMSLFTNVPATVKTAEDLLRALRDEQATGNRVRGDLFAGMRPPPLLLQGELKADQSGVLMPPADLRELAWFAAMDLSRGAAGGDFKADAPRLFRVGDLTLRGKVEAVDADGWQQLDIQVKSTPEMALRDDTKRFVDAYVRPHVLYAFDARLRVRRRLEQKDGKARVVEFRSDLQGSLTRGKDWKEPAGQLQQIETWRLLAARDNQDATFRGDVRKAILRGVAFLKPQLADLAKPDLAPQADDGGESYHAGRIAVALLALVKGGVPKTDPVITAAFAALKQRKLIDTYTLANAMMALDAFYAPASEVDDLRTGVIDRPRRRQLPPEDLAVMDRWTTQLLANIDTRVDPAYLLRFNYTRGPRYDHSVNQYGLLGLYSAHLAGVPISVQVWEAAANHLLAAQGEATGKIELDLVDYRTFARLQAEPNAGRSVARLQTRSAGWFYDQPKVDGERTPRYGSMTCAGITGLTICQAGLLDHPEVKRVKLLGDITTARNAGFGWLAERLQTRYHPGDIDHQQVWVYYYLYGLERAALLSGVALIQDRDWYFEGAMVLLGLQGEDGNWPSDMAGSLDYERDAMAILFLKQSTSPVLTGK